MAQQGSGKGTYAIRIDGVKVSVISRIINRLGGRQCVVQCLPKIL